VAVAADGVGVAAEEHVGDVAGAEALARAHHGRQGLLRIDGGVVGGDLAGAHVAMAARAARLAEIGEQRLAAT
jgi:hypothetical protein